VTPGRTVPAVILAGSRILVALAITIAAAACSTTPPTSTGTPGIGPASGSGATGSLEPPGSFGAPPSPSPPDETSPLVVDHTLLAFLPESVDGFPVKEDIDEAARALSDPGLTRIASTVDAGVAVDGGTSNLVYAWIVRLRREAFGEGAYRQWRDSYDEGACAAAGGVVGRAEAQIGGRKTYVTSCVAGLHTYHVWLEDHDILISASAVGAGRFGEKLLEGLRVPA
jgi:hypothetical protein